MRISKIIKNATFGNLTIIQPKSSYYFEPAGRKLWKTIVKCNCGIEFETKNFRLTNGNLTKCDQCSYIDKLSTKIGDTFDMLTVVGFVKDNENRLLLKCKCSCGSNKEIITRLSTLKSRPNNHCDCLPPAHCVKIGKLYRTFFNKIKSRALTKKIEFNITMEQLWNLYKKQNGKCALSGIDIGFGIMAKLTSTASLDRIDSSLGYTINNVQWVHKEVNQMKMDLDQEFFIKMCKLIAKNSNLFYQKMISRVSFKQFPF